MKMEEYDGKGGMQTVRTRLLRVQRRKMTNSATGERFEVVYVYTEDGAFSCYRQKFDKMGVDLERLKENDEVDVDFYKNAKGYNVLAGMSPAVPF